MNIGGITYPDVNNGLGCRVTLWVSGCSHHCKGCHNPETWNFSYGDVFDNAEKEELFSLLSLPFIKGLTLSGGDPVDSYDDVLSLVKEFREKFDNKKDIWLYTGYTIDDLQDKELLKYVDYIVDGEYIEEERDLSLAFRGSKNQTIWMKNENGVFIKSELN